MIYITGEFQENFISQQINPAIPTKQLASSCTKEDLRAIGMPDGYAYFYNGNPDGDHTLLFAGIVELETTSLGGMSCLWGDSESPDAEFTRVEPRKSKGLYALFGKYGYKSPEDFFAHARKIYYGVPDVFRDYLITEVNEYK